MDELPKRDPPGAGAGAEDAGFEPKRLVVGAAVAGVVELPNSDGEGLDVDDVEG